jgi:hemoglobin
MQINFFFLHQCSANMSNSELYHKIGGEPAIDAIITEFHSLLKKDPVLPHFFKTWTHHVYQKQYLIHLFTGNSYSRPSLSTVHHKLQIEHTHFDRFLDVFDSAMKQVRVSNAHRKQVLTILEGTRYQVVKYDYTMPLTLSVLALSVVVIVVRKFKMLE